MIDGTYLRAQAKRCFELSQQCFDLTVAEQLRVLSESFDAKARDIELAPSRPRLARYWSGLERVVTRLRALAARYDAWRIRAG
jgi:hypothetical protein